MASRRLVPASVREALLGIPSDIASLERNYLLADDDLDLIGTRRRPENRLGLALHIALLRHPGQGWHDDTEPPAPTTGGWLAEQIEVPFPSLARYGSRGAAVLALALFEEQLREAIESRDVAFNRENRGNVSRSRPSRRGSSRRTLQCRLPRSRRSR